MTQELTITTLILINEVYGEVDQKKKGKKIMGKKIMIFIVKLVGQSKPRMWTNLPSYVLYDPQCKML